ncbi:thioredoxin family protein [Actinoplanes sichuanensis]|uniref:TlpA family protein disulfide reductase n=1 Tax=Actinoplanes sichuanensis TaxID=512349 RepID=A0ABW4A8B2_9ACTN|nr:thioredoxin family protein [Actinoplanes sichuanensis]BEL09109.1 thioredoxin family protein [Actinoplanes sichuanensis]
MDPVGIGAVVIVLVMGIAAGLWRRRSEGRLAVTPGASEDQRMKDVLERLGVEPGSATLLQFSTAFCAPCRAVRRVSSEVAAMMPGARHVEVDAESHLDEVRELGIWRTPTLLILDAEGREVRRATGVPTKPHLIAALADLVPSPGAGR